MRRILYMFIASCFVVNHSAARRILAKKSPELICDQITGTFPAQMLTADNIIGVHAYTMIIVYKQIAVRAMRAGNHCK